MSSALTAFVALLFAALLTIGVIGLALLVAMSLCIRIGSALLLASMLPALRRVVRATSVQNNREPDQEPHDHSQVGTSSYKRALRQGLGYFISPQPHE